MLRKFCFSIMIILIRDQPCKTMLIILIRQALHQVIGLRGLILFSSSLFLGAAVVKGPPGDAGDSGHTGWIPVSGTSPAEENSNPLQDSRLENPTDRGAWRATVHGVAKSQT